MVEPRYAWRVMTPADDGHRNGGGAAITANEGQRRQWNDDVRLSAWRRREPMTAGVTAMLPSTPACRPGRRCSTSAAVAPGVLSLQPIRWDRWVKSSGPTFLSVWWR